jgi:hypothetical protein
MSTIEEIVKKTQIGQINGIASASTGPHDLDTFKTVIAEMRALQQTGDIEIIDEQQDRVRFKRIR